MTRRNFLGAATESGLARPFKRSVAITIDDLNPETVPQKWRKQVDGELLGLLGRRGIRAAVFVVGKYTDEPGGMARVQRWGDAGHILGNHTYSHRALGIEVGAPDFERDILRNELVLDRFSAFRRFFRFPMLKEGGTAAERDRVRAFLVSHGYRNGAVTIDGSDWYYSSRLVDRLTADARFSVERYREPYIRHILGRAEYYDRISQAVLGRSVRHTLLIHYNLINFLFPEGLLDALEQQGWKFIDASEAFGDPVYERRPRIAPAGESLLWALAKASGRFEGALRYPGEDGSYEKPILDQLGL